MNKAAVNDGSVSYTFLNPSISTLSSVTSAIMGIIITVLAVGIPIIVALEVLYINIPIFRSSLNKIGDKHNMFEKSLGLVFRDARTAIERADTVHTGRSANSEYIRIKVWVIFIAFLLIGLSLGGIGTVLRLLTSWVQRILSIFI